MHRINRTLGFGIGLVVLGAGLAGCSTKAKSWTFMDAEGSIRTLADYHGKVVVLSFSNSWCDPCQAAAPHMQAIKERFAGQPVKVMNVASWEHGHSENYMAAHGYTYDLMTNGTDIAREWNVTEIPTFVVLSVNGKVLDRYEGFSLSTPGKITATVQKHLAKVARNPGRYRTVAQGK